MKMISGFSSLLFLFLSCMSSGSKKQVAQLSDCDCKDLAYKIMMNEQSSGDFDKMKTCIVEGEKKNSKVTHANQVGDMAEAFLGFSELCDQHTTENNATNQTAAMPAQSFDTLSMKSKDNHALLSSEYLGVYHGIQATYFAKNQDGGEMVINGQKVSIPSSDFMFELKENNLVSMQQTNLEDNSRYSYDGTYQIINESPDNLVVECSLNSSDGSRPVYTLSITKSSKTGNCIGQNEPEFVIKKMDVPVTIDSNYANDQTSKITNNDIITNQTDTIRKENDTTKTSSYPTGYYVVNASETHKIYFHNLPDESTRRRAYIDSQVDVYVQKVSNGFGYIDFTNDWGQRSVGWIDMKDLVLKP